MGVTAGTGHWYKAGEGLVPTVRVFVKDRTGTHRDEYFFSTDTAVATIEAYAGRWNLEIFQRILKRRDLDGQEPGSPQEIIAWLEAVTGTGIAHRRRSSGAGSVLSGDVGSEIAGIG